jgi:hypothetical protein
LPNSLFTPLARAFFKNHKSMSTYNYAPGAVHLDFHHNNISMSATQIADLVRLFITDDSSEKSSDAEDVSPVDTSFFCTNQFSEDIIEKNLRQAINLASSKADACRRVMALEPLGYVVLSNVTDERKAELVNPFAMPKYTLTGEDFRKARNT